MLTLIRVLASIYSIDDGLKQRLLEQLYYLTAIS
jgi:hypothetical protein